MIHSASAYPRLQVGSDVDNLDRPNARDPPATARRERAYKFGQAQRARGVQLFGHEPKISVPASRAHARGVQLFGHPRRQFFETPKPTPRTNATRRREYRRGGRRDRQRAPRRSRAVRGLNQHSRLTTSECWLRRPRSRSRSVVVSRAIMKCMRRSACMRLLAITAAARRSPGSVSNRLV